VSKNTGSVPATRATIKDVASAAKTGKTSISRYLNGEQHLLSDALKARIERAISLLNYQPSQMARSLKSGQTRLIGLIIADITNPYSVQVMRGVEEACREQGLTLLVCNTNNELHQEQHYLQLMSSYRVDGIVVNAVGMREDAISTLQQAAMPMVLGSVPATRATIKDVASAAKTGKTSISRYLNGEQHLLSDALKARIERAISLLNYQPSQMARSLKSGQTRLIGLIIADITNPYSVQVMRGVEEACREQGLTLLVCNTNNELHQEQHYLQLMSSYRVDGIVVNAVGMREDAISTLQQAAMPMVLIDRKVANFSCDMVGLDNLAQIP